MLRTITCAMASVALSALLTGPAIAQTPKPIEPNLGQLADGKGAQVFNRNLTGATGSGRAVARLDARAGDGGALLDGVQVGDGVIEVDLRGKDVAQQSFLGIAFHVVDWTHLRRGLLPAVQLPGGDARSSAPARSSTSPTRPTPGRSCGPSGRASSRRLSSRRRTPTAGSTRASSWPTGRSRST